MAGSRSSGSSSSSSYYEINSVDVPDDVVEDKLREVDQSKRD